MPVPSLLAAISEEDPEGSQERVEALGDQVAELEDDAPQDIAEDVSRIREFWDGLASDLASTETPEEFDALAVRNRDQLDDLTINNGPILRVLEFYADTCLEND